MQKRLVFDFEIQFTHGGVLRGTNYCLDLQRDSIPDDYLAQYLISDMHLLMVGSVRIFNKQIIQEADQRLFMLMLDSEPDQRIPKTLTGWAVEFACRLN